MIITSKDMNHKVMARIRQKAHLEKRTLADGQIVLRAIHHALKVNIKAFNIINFGIFYLKPNNYKLWGNVFFGLQRRSVKH